MLHEAESYVRSDPQRTIEIAAEAEELASKDRDIQLRVRAALLRSRACIHMGKTDEGEVHARRAFNYATASYDVIGLGRSINELGIYCFIRSRFDDALQHYKEAERLFRSSDATHDVGKVLLNVGNVYHRLGDFASSLSYYEQCLEIAQQVGDEILEAKVLTNMTPFFELLIYDTETSLNYASRTIEVFKKMGDLVGLAKAYSNMASYQRRNGDYDAAIMYSQMALDIDKKFSEPIDHLSNYYSLAYSYLLKDEVVNARDVIDQGLELSTQFPMSPGTLYVQLANAKVMLAEGRYAESLDVALRTKEEMHALGLEGDASEAELDVADAYSALGMYDKSSPIYRHIVETKEADTRTRMDHRLSYIRSKYEVQHSKNMAEIERLRNVELAEAVRRLEELNAQKSEYLAFIAHELKNPLSTIRSIAALLTADPLMHTKERRELEAQILTISSRMFDLITSLLERARTERERPEEVSLVDAATVWTHIVMQAGYAARDKHIEIITDADAVSYPVIATEQHLVTIAGNLLSNAVKFSPPNSTVRVTMRQTQSTKGNGKPVVLFSVTDEGPGISPDEMPLLFEPFQKLSTTPTAGEHSTGLGLHIVKRDVESLNGLVWCESTPGKGASFFVELPLAVDDSERGPLTIVRKMA
jgi:signal transduction histidine kinase